MLVSGRKARQMGRLLCDKVQQLLASHTPPWNCPATSLTQRWVYSMGLAIGMCVRNCCGRKQGSPTPTCFCQPLAAESHENKRGPTKPSKTRSSLQGPSGGPAASMLTSIKLEAVDPCLGLELAQSIHEPGHSLGVRHIEGDHRRCVPPASQQGFSCRQAPETRLGEHAPTGLPAAVLGRRYQVPSATICQV